MSKLEIMKGVRSDESPVELWRDDESGRLTIRAYNEAGYNCTDIDFWDLVEWLKLNVDRYVLEQQATDQPEWAKPLICKHGVNTRQHICRPCAARAYSDAVAEMLE